MFGSHYCKSCGHVGDPVRFNRGTWKIEVFLWLAAAVFICFSVLNVSFALLGFNVQAFRLLHAADIAGVIMVASAVIFTVGRRIGAYKGCRSCGSAAVIPTDTPLATEAITERKQFRREHYTPVLGLNDR